MERAVKFFGLNNLALDSDLGRLERELKVRFREPRQTAEFDDYYAQIPGEIRSNARTMGDHYELFYCLEVSIRELVRGILAATEPSDWWEKLVPQVVRDNAEKSQKKEIQSGVTPRSNDMLSYTNFGELGEIIKSNWTLFAGTFSDPRAVEGTLARLNTLRAPIMHCSRLGEDEVVRLRLSLRDWFRLME